MIEPAPRTVDEVDALLEDHEDDPIPRDSVPVVDEVDDPRVLRAGIWSCY